MYERLTERKNGLVYYKKDDRLYQSVLMENFDIYKVLMRLAYYEDKEEERRLELNEHGEKEK
jgi:hypothetical protein